MNRVTINKHTLKAIKYYSPLFIYMSLLFILSFSASTQSVPIYFGMTEKDIAQLNLAIFTYGAPLIIFISGIYGVNLGYNIYKYQLNPPPNLPAFTNTTPKRPTCPTCLFILSIFFLLLSIYLVYFGHGVYNEIISNKST